VISPSEIETSCRVVLRPRRRFDNEKSRTAIAQTLLDFEEQARSATMTLRVRMNGDPVKIECAIGPRRCAEAGVRDEVFLIETAEEFVLTGDRVIEQLERDLHFIGTEDGCRVEDFPQSSAVCPLQRAEPHCGHLIQ
jgi:hypothetical protein